MYFTTIYVNGDTNIRSTETGKNFGSESYLPLGRMDGEQIDRILFGFNFTPFSGKIIDSAILYLYQDCSGYCFSDRLDFYAKCISSAWSEDSVKYSNQPLISESAQILLSLTGNTNGQRNFDITDLVKNIVENNRDCYGIMLTQANESLTGKRKQFYSKEYDNGSRKPYIIISYHNPIWLTNLDGAINKEVLSIMTNQSKGTIDKIVVGMKVAAEQGQINKTVF